MIKLLLCFAYSSILFAGDDITVADIIKGTNFPELKVYNPYTWKTDFQDNNKVLLQQNDLLKKEMSACISNISKKDSQYTECYKAMNLAFLADAVAAQHLKDLARIKQEIGKVDPKMEDQDLAKSEKDAVEIAKFANLAVASIPFYAHTSEFRREFNLREGVKSSKDYFEANKGKSKVELASPILKKTDDVLSKAKADSIEDPDLQKEYFSTLDFGADDTARKENFQKIGKYLGKQDLPFAQSNTGVPAATAPAPGQPPAASRGGWADLLKGLTGRDGTTKRGEEGIGTGTTDTLKKTAADKKTDDPKAPPPPPVGTAPAAPAGGSGGGGSIGSPSLSSDSGSDWRSNYLKSADKMRHETTVPKWSAGAGAKESQFGRDVYGIFGAGASNNSIWGGDALSSPSSASSASSVPQYKSKDKDALSSPSSLDAALSSYYSPSSASPGYAGQQRMDYLSRMAEYNRLTGESATEQVNRYIDIFNLINSVHYYKITKGEAMSPWENNDNEYLTSTPRPE